MYRAKAMYFDSHTHSMASPDSEMNPQAAVAELKKSGLGIAFTEHVDFSEHIEKDPLAADAPCSIGDFVCDFDIYPAQYEKLRGEGVTLGLEFGMTSAFLTLNRRLAEAYDYDCIVGAVHCVDGDDIYRVSLSSPDTLSGVRRYLIYAREMLEKYDFIDTFAHIDYIARYTQKMAEDFVYERYASDFDALLKKLAERGIALEINTNRFGDKSKRAEKTMYELCSRYKELGGRYCTIGSDAHKTEKLGYCVDSAKTIAHEAELSVVYFKNRKAIPCE
jgi:histidinol-phosphatase (PHP family)